MNEGLSGIVSLAAKSPEEDRTLKKIEGMYSAIYTPKSGEVSSKSDLALLQKEIQALEENYRLSMSVPGAWKISAWNWRVSPNSSK